MTGRMTLGEIPLRETLHLLGWKGAQVEDAWLERIRAAEDAARAACEPRFILRRFPLEQDGRLAGTTFRPEGKDAGELLAPCHEAILLAATLGAQSERLLLRTQAKDPCEALILDAVLSAAIESVCDRAQADCQAQLASQGLYLTDRFSPGYGDMPMEMTRGVCDVLQCARAIGLTVSQSGLMIPRKSVCAIMGVSRTPTTRRLSRCAGCKAKHCALREDGETKD